MKKNRNARLSTKFQESISRKDDRRREVRRQFWLRLAAIFLAIIFIVSECAILLPLE